MTSQHRQIFYAVMAVIGAVVTWYFNLRFMGAHSGFSLAEFIAATHANDAATSIANDLLVVVIAFFFWSFFEARRLNMKHWWLLIPLTLGVAIAVTYPAFLLFRERAIARNAATA